MTLCLVALALALVWWRLMLVERFAGPFAAAGSRVRGHMLEVLLYGAFPKTMLSALGSVTHACAALSLSLLLPSLVFTPLLLAGAVLAGSVYGHRAPAVGEPVLVTLESADKSRLDWTLQPSPDYAIDIDGFRADTGTVYWRVRPMKEGTVSLHFQAGGLTLDKSLQAGHAYSLSSSRRSLGWKWLLSPLEAPISSSRDVSSLSVEYPARTLGWRGWSAPWWLLLLLGFLAWSWVLALVLRPGKRVRGHQSDKL